MKFLENKTILIIGLGLIGGSVARGLSASVPGVRILAHGRDESALQSALIDGSIHAYSTDLGVMAPQADIIMLCTPTLTVRVMLEQLKDLVGPEVIITDAASVKGNIVNDARRFFADSLHRFVPGHPIAGSEQSGYKASRIDLFHNRKVILTPLAENSPQAVTTVMQLWQVLGADVHGMTPERHDEVLAATSHLPHLLAFTLVNTLVDSVSEQDRAQQVFDYAAGGFADFSRIASSDPHMWRDIFLANRDSTVDVLDAYISNLGDMRQKLLTGDGNALQFEFARAKRVRDEFIRRFKSSGVTSENVSVSGFTEVPGHISVRPGSSLGGSYRLPANLTVALAALEHSSNIAGVTRIEGFPESIAALNAIQKLRAAGIPIVGPERGSVWVYGKPESATWSVVTSTVVLPADPFLTGLLVLGAAILPGSTVVLQDVAETTEQGSLLHCLEILGAQMEFADTRGDGVELICKSSVLKGVTLDLSTTQLQGEQLLLVLAGAALAAGDSRIELDTGRIHGLFMASSSVLGWAADFQFSGSVLNIYPRALDVTQLDLSGNVALSLLAIVMAQRVNGELIITQPGEIAETYPGLLRMMAEMGFGLGCNTPLPVISKH